MKNAKEELLINREREALQNAINSSKISDLELHQKYSSDKRQTNGRFFITHQKRCISPVLQYNELNYFILGLNRASQLTSQ